MNSLSPGCLTSNSSIIHICIIHFTWLIKYLIDCWLIVDCLVVKEENWCKIVCFFCHFFFCHLFLLTCPPAYRSPTGLPPASRFSQLHNQLPPKQSNNLPNKLHNRVATLIVVLTCLAVSKFNFCHLKLKNRLPLLLSVNSILQLLLWS